MEKKWSTPKGRKTQTVKKHTRRVDVRDMWGRFSHSKNIKIEEYKRRKPKTLRKPKASTGEVLKILRSN